MSSLLDTRLSRLINHHASDLLSQAQMGLERETLRITANGHLSQAPHPLTLGSTLTHPQITTDYAESLLEFVTPPFAQVDQALTRLDQLQHFAVSRLEGEILWQNSMPCIIGGETQIPIARYGSSNMGKLKHLYRVGLGHRYGKMMQMIAGIHFNFSLTDSAWQQLAEMEGYRGTLQDFRSQRYLDLIRNVQRYGFIVAYFFGASPAVCHSFFADKEDQLPVLDEHTRYMPYGTSLRLSDLGYSNRTCPFHVSTNSLEHYVRDLLEAVRTPCAAFEKIGVLVDGTYRQMNNHILQIENEYYTSIRPKQIGAEHPAQALQKRGIGYVELRSLDVSPFDACGTNSQTLRFLQTFLTTCLLMDSPILGRSEKEHCDQNQLVVAAKGRDPALQIALEYNGKQQPLKSTLSYLLTQMEGVSEILGTDHQAGLSAQYDKVHDSEATPSARVLREMREQKLSFHEFARFWSDKHHADYLSQTLAASHIEQLEAQADESLQKQKQIESQAQQPFAEYLTQFMMR